MSEKVEEEDDVKVEEESVHGCALAYANNFSMCRFFPMHTFPNPSNPPRNFVLWSNWGAGALQCWNTHINVRGFVEGMCFRDEEATDPDYQWLMDAGVREGFAKRLRKEVPLTLKAGEVAGVWACLPGLSTMKSFEEEAIKDEVYTIFALIQTKEDSCILWHWKPEMEAVEDKPFFKVRVPSPVQHIQAQLGPSMHSFGNIVLENGYCTHLWSFWCEEMVEWYDVNYILGWLKKNNVDEVLHAIINDYSSFPFSYPSEKTAWLRDNIRPVAVEKTASMLVKG